MKYNELHRDAASGLALIRDERDPPRYYVEERRRRDLLSIGDYGEAVRRFGVRLERQWERVRGAGPAASPGVAASAPPNDDALKAA